MLAVWFYFPGQVERLLSDEILLRGKETAHNLERMAQGPLILGDRPALGQLAKSSLRTGEILYVVIIDKDGQTLAESLAQSGVVQLSSSNISAILPQAQKSEADWSRRDSWPFTREPFFHVARPVFYEQVRVGTIVLGVSLRQAQAAQRRWRILIPCFGLGFLLLASVVGWVVARSAAIPMRQMVAQLADESKLALEITGSLPKELLELKDHINTNRELYQKSINELELQNLEFTQQLAQLQEKNNSQASRLNAVTRQLGSLQQRISQLPNATAEDTPLPPTVQMALSMAGEINSVMRQITANAGALQRDIQPLLHFIEQLEKAPDASPESLQAIHDAWGKISYDKIHQQIDQLMETIQGGAAWSEQMADLLKMASRKV